MSRLTWPQLSTPQNATPFTLNGHKYLLETDEFGSGENIGAARIIDIENEKKPFVVSNLRLAVNKGEQTEDPGDDQPFQGYQGHYCSLPSRVDPVHRRVQLHHVGTARLRHPRSGAPEGDRLLQRSVDAGEHQLYPTKAGAFAMSAPAYDQETGDIWYTDGNTGFYVVRLTGAAAPNRFAKRVVNPGS